MYYPPHDNDPEVQAEVNAEINRTVDRFKTWAKRVWDWFKDDLTPNPHGGVFVPAMGFGGIGSYYQHPAGACTNPACTCGGARERADLPPPVVMPTPGHPLIIQGKPITPELSAVFSHWGEVTGIVASSDGSIGVHYKDGFEVTYEAVQLQGGVNREGL